jgi:acetyl-CoA synthetase
MSTLHRVPPEFAAKARIKAEDYARLYDESVRDPEGFWGRVGKRLDWIKPYTRVKDVSFDANNLHIRWFEDGQLNLSANCLDRHLAARGDKTAILWEGDDPAESRAVSYRELHEQVCRAANLLKNLGVKKGDRVTIYLPMIPEAAVAMLACARIGAIHSIVFGGFSPDSLAGRIADCASKLIITADEGLRGGKKVPLKVNVDEALTKPDTTSVETVLVVKRTGSPINMQAPRDRWWDALMAEQDSACAPEPMDAEDPLFILYTSGSTGKPKGVLHTTGGYGVFASFTHECVFDVRDDDVYWCTADVGWVTGHSYIVYGPLANGATSLMFEGVPNYPDSSRFWQVVDKHKVTLFYTAPTAIRALMRDGEGPVKKWKRTSLRLLGSVGEPINPEAWEWYWRVVGDGRCPIVDTWWQTETGGILITPLPGAIDQKPGSATKPFFGVKPAIVDAAGTVLERRQSRADRFVAGSDAHGVRGSPALHRHLFQDLSRHLFHRRRRTPRRRRLLLDHRPCRRRHQRLRPSPGNRGSRKRIGRPSESRRSRRRRLSDRNAGLPAMGAGPAEDALRQDHAENSAQDRRERARSARRHFHAGRSNGRAEPGRRTVGEMKARAKSEGRAASIRCDGPAAFASLLIPRL